MKSKTTVAALAGAAVLLCAGTAEAKTYKLATGTTYTKGKARASGNITFPSAKRFHVKGSVDDICPKDGYGAYIEFKINFAGGGYARTVRKDTDTCKKRANHYDFGRGFSRKIKSVGVTLIEIDADTNAVGDAARKLVRR
jgi:hypothetical protein